MRHLLPLVLLGFTACAANNLDAAPALSTTSGDANMHTVANPAASFGQYRTFSFGPTEGPPVGYQPSARSAEVQRRLKPLITAALMQRGYTPVGANGDIVIMLGAGRRDVSTHDVSSMGVEWQPDDENADFVEGAIVIDAFDGAKGIRVWHGANRADIDPDRIDQQRLQHAVQALISSFPAVSSAAR